MRPDEQPMPVRIARLRAAIAADPAAIAPCPRGEMLYQALEGLTTGTRVRDLDALVGRLADDTDPVLRRAGLRLLRRGVRSGALTPGRARLHLDRLLQRAQAADGEVLVGVLREFAEPWVTAHTGRAPTRHGSLPAERLRPFLAGELPVTDAALAAAVAHGHVGLLLDAVTDESVGPRTRQRALGDLGRLADRDVIPAVLAIAAADPLLFGEPAVACLLSLHRRGLFPGDESVAAIVDLAVTVHSVPLDDVATILYTGRQEALRAVTRSAPEPRRFALLTALARQAPGDLPVGAAVTALLAGLPKGSSERAGALAVLRDLRYGPAEEAVLDALVDLPGPALRTLEAIGGRRTVEVVSAGLLGGAEHLLPVQRTALELWWHLTDSPDERRALVARLNPRDLPPRIAADLGAPDPLELAVLRLGFDPDNPADALVRLTRTGDAGTVPVVTDLLARIVADLSPRDSDTEPTVPADVVQALRDLGARLHARARIRPVSLLDAADAGAAGRALVTGIVLDLLERDGRPERERVILLALLRDVAAGPELPGGLSRLLWHRDRHVRKHAIALLATVPATVRAVSASLAALARAGDAPTVRHAVTALGAAGARWAAPLIAGGLDHPAMNVKKAAVDALATAGTPAEVPAILGWLGRHDNPGFRASLVVAAVKILGDAFLATVLSAAESAAENAAENADQERSRDLLLAALAGRLNAHAVDALAEHRSPVAPALLAMLADRRLRLPGTTVTGLADRFRAYGLTPPEPEVSGQNRMADDIATLVEHGWRAEPAERVVDGWAESPYLIDKPRQAALRRFLPRFLERGADRPDALALAVHLGRTPWPPDETGVYVDAVRTLTTALPTITLGQRDIALGWLESVAPHLPAAERSATAALIRDLTTGFGRRSALPLLRRCGAVLTRADLDRALAAARVGPDPWEVEPDILRQAFDPTVTDDDPIPSRRRLARLIADFPKADAETRPAFLAEMEALQPIGAPQWTITERATTGRPGPDPDEPRSAALRANLLADLDAADPATRNAAAETLMTWPEPEIRRAVLTAYLAGRFDGIKPVRLAPDLPAIDLDALPAEARERAAELAIWASPDDRLRLMPTFLRWWEESAGHYARNALRIVPPDALAVALQSRLDAGAWGVLDLLRGVEVTATPALSASLEKAHDAGIATTVKVIDGALRGPDGLTADLAALADLRTAPPAGPTPTRADLLDTVRDTVRSARPGARPGPGGEADAAARRALARLAEIDEDRGATGAAADPELAALLGELMRHPQRRMRLLAHRTSRRLLARETYLEHTVTLLTDPQPEIVRAALRAVSYAGYRPAIPTAVDLLDHPDPVVRRAADAALIHYGPDAEPALTHAVARARPDRRPKYAAVLERIASSRYT